MSQQKKYSYIYIVPELKEMWYLSLYPYLTIMLGKITFQTPLSIKTKYSNSGQFLQKCIFMRVRKIACRHVCSFAAYAVWVTLCSHQRVCVERVGKLGKLHFWVTDEWERSDFWDVTTTTALQYVAVRATIHTHKQWQIFWQYITKYLLN